MDTVFVLGELFCGPGGLSLGAKMAASQVDSVGKTYKIEHAWGVDRDETAIQTYSSNGLGTGVVRDAVEFATGLSAPGKKSIEDFPHVNALAFGFPCNDFSSVGKQKGMDGSFGNLYKAGLAAIEYSNPEWFIAENVSGISTANSGSAFKKILRELKLSGKYGYRLTTHLYHFEQYGVAQTRHRYIIVGIRNDLNKEFAVPESTRQAPYKSVVEELGNPYSATTKNMERSVQSRRVANRLLLTPPGKNAWFLDFLYELPIEKAREELQILPWYDRKIALLSDADLHDLIVSSKLHCVSAKMSHIYRRLVADKPSYTLTGSGGGGTHVYHWEECRSLSNRERARLQSFPDWFEFAGTKEEVRRQIGMAVPPRAAQIIFESVLKTMAGIPYGWVPSNGPKD